MLKIKSATNELKIYDKDLDIIQKNNMASFGYVCLEIEGKYIYINPYDVSDKEKVEKMLGLEGYKWFQEDSGDKKWVIYNPKHYKIDKDWEQRKILKFNTAEYDGQPLETPINASSLSGMFSWMIIPSNIRFSNRFVLKDIKDMSLMFVGSNIPDDADLSRCLITDKVISTRYMFYRATLPKNNNIANYLNTKNVKNMEYMFGQTLIPNGYEFNLDTRNAENMKQMFSKTRFGGKATFGDKFKINKGCKTDGMFEECIINNEIIYNNISFENASKMLS